MLACQAVFITIMAGASVPAHAESQERRCPILLMDFECSQYHQRLDQATSDAQHRQIVREYEKVLEDRQRACRVSKSLERQAALLHATPQQQ